LRSLVPILRKGNFKVLNYNVGGDAPKNFISLYEYEQGTGVRKANHKTWPKYIAKVGHKWYPLESVNEYLFNQIGEELGLNMAHSRLILVGNQLRFLSRYFLKPNEILVHGAEIFYGYLSDKEFVDSIEQKQLARKFFTFQFALAAMGAMFPMDSEQIAADFVKMLVFDAVTGNNDRHFYNWGVVKHVENKCNPLFAPVYDSARGLFWNEAESKLEMWYDNMKQLDDKIKKYAEGSKPKTGWEGMDDLNHFDLIGKIFSHDSRYRSICSSIISEQNKEKVLLLVKSKFKNFYSPIRIDAINRCLIYRFDRLKDLITQ
jgi:hypothetical protein